MNHSLYGYYDRFWEKSADPQKAKLFEGKPPQMCYTIRRTVEPLRFGWLGSYGYFNGCVREVSLYRRSMTAAEVFARYKSGR